LARASTATSVRAMPCAAALAIVAAAHRASASSVACPRHTGSGPGGTWATIVFGRPVVLCAISRLAASTTCGVER
jgi:hypothetical protein